ncbi:MAG: hypothetical protein QOJ03_3199, partial [Frankiaceae bacterium]|nr:hypothetical protein [Frankiaceae bacterium]
MPRIMLSVIVAAATLAACTSGGSSTPGSTSTTTDHTAGAPTPRHTAPPAIATGWPTYHGNNMRTGVSPARPLQPPLQRAWATRLDGAVYAQPLVIGRVLVAATENNTVYALDATTGRRIWKHHLGSPVPLQDLPCGNIDPLGITGTPVYDAQSGSVFVATETTGGHHTLHALDLRTGRERWHRGLDVYPARDRAAEQQRSALLLTHGRVYVAFGGLFGDCGNYVGYVAAVGTDGSGPILHYAVPTAREAGIWSPAGPVQGKTLSDIFVASGNGAEVGGSYDGSDSVIRLTPTLHEVGLFAPSTWSADNAADLDLGSSSPVPLPSGQTVIAGKRGTVYLLDPDLGGVGGERAALDGCAAYGGAALAGARTVLMPCSDGVRRLNLGAHSMHWSWRLDGVAGSP